MANVGYNSAVLTGACQVSRPPPTIRLSLNICGVTTSHFSWPSPSSTGKAKELAVASCPRPRPGECDLDDLPSELGSRSTDFDEEGDRQYDEGLRKDDRLEIFEAPARSWSAPSLKQPYDPTQGRCQHMESSPTNESSATTPIRRDTEDSGYSGYGTRDGQDEEQVENNIFQTRSLQRDDTTPRAQTSSPEGIVGRDDEQGGYEVGSALDSIRSGHDNNSELDVDIQARQMRARERVLILRERVHRTRRIIKSLGSELRQLRANVTTTVDNIATKLHEAVLTGEKLDISQYYETLQAAQIELGPAEENYSRWEIQRDEDEEDLEQEEDYFYRHNIVDSLIVPEAKVNEPLSPRVEASQPPAVEVQDLSPEELRVQRYLDTIAEADQVKDELDDIESDYVRFSIDTEFRKRHGITLSSESKTFFAEYSRLLADTQDRLLDIEDRIFEQRRACIEDGLFGEADHMYEHYDAFREDILDVVDEAKDLSPLRRAAHQTKYFDRVPDYSDKKEYVNSWLLDLAQESSINLLLLRTIIYSLYPFDSANGTDIANLNWAELSLRWWNDDEAGDHANQLYNASRLDAIVGSTRKHHDSLGSSIDADFGDDVVDVIIMGSETGSYATQKEGHDTTPKKRRISV